MAPNQLSSRQHSLEKWQENPQTPSDDFEVTEEELRLQSSHSRNLTSAGTGYEPPSIDQLNHVPLPVTNSTIPVSKLDHQPTQHGSLFLRPVSSGPTDKDKFTFAKAKKEKIDLVGTRKGPEAGSQNVTIAESSEDTNGKRSSPQAETRPIATNLEHHVPEEGERPFSTVRETFAVHSNRAGVDLEASTHGGPVRLANTSKAATRPARPTESTVTVQCQKLDQQPQPKELNPVKRQDVDAVHTHLEAASSQGKDQNTDLSPEKLHAESNGDTRSTVHSSVLPEIRPESASDTPPVRKGHSGERQTLGTRYTSEDRLEQRQNMDQHVLRGQTQDQNAQDLDPQERHEQPIGSRAVGADAEPETTKMQNAQAAEMMLQQERSQHLQTSTAESVALHEGNATHLAGKSSKKMNADPSQPNQTGNPEVSSDNKLRTNHIKRSSDTVSVLQGSSDTDDSSADTEPSHVSAVTQSLVMVFQNLEREEVARKKRAVKEREREQELKEKQEVIDYYDVKLLEEVERNRKLEVETEQFKQSNAQATAVGAKYRSLADAHAVLQAQYKNLSENQQASAFQLAQLKEACQKSARDVKEVKEAAKQADQQKEAGSKVLLAERRASDQLKKELEAAKSTAETELSTAMQSLERKTQGELASLRDIITQQPKISPEMLQDIVTEIQTLKNQHVNLLPALAGVRELFSTTMKTHSENVKNGFAELKKSQEQFATIRSVEGHIRHALEGLKNELISCQELQDQVRKLTSDHAALQQNQQAQSSHVSSLEARRNELEVALAGAKERLAEYEAKLRDAAARPVVDIGVAKRLQQAENELTELRTERDRLQSEVDHEKETHNAGTEQLNGLLSESSTMRSDLQRLNEMIAAREEKEAAMKLEVETAVRQEMHKAHKQMDQAQTSKHANELFQARQDAQRLKIQLETSQKELVGAKHAEESLKAEVSKHAEAQNQAVQLSEVNSRLQEELRAQRPTAEQKRLHQEDSAKLADVSKKHDTIAKEKARLEKELKDTNAEFNAVTAVAHANEKQTRVAAELEAECTRLRARVETLEDELRQRSGAEDGVQAVQKSTGISQQMEAYDFGDDFELQDVELSQEGLRHVRPNKHVPTKRHEPPADDRDELDSQALTYANTTLPKRRKVNRNASTRFGAQAKSAIDTANESNTGRLGRRPSNQSQTEQPRLSQADSDMLFEEYVNPTAYADAEENRMAKTPSQSMIPETQFSGPRSIFDMRETLTPTHRQQLRSGSQDFGLEVDGRAYARGPQRAGSNSQNAPNSSSKRFPQQSSHGNVVQNGFSAMDGHQTRVDFERSPARAPLSVPLQRSANRVTTQFTLPTGTPSTPKMPQHVESTQKSQHAFRKPSLPSANEKRPVSDAMDDHEPSRKRTKSHTSATELASSQGHSKQRLKSTRAPSQAPVTRRRSSAEKEATGHSVLSKPTACGTSPFKAANAAKKASASIPKPDGKLRKVNRAVSSRGSNHGAYTPAKAANVFNSHLQRAFQQKP